jgi:membrane-bound lytic murein transglycosylase D
VKKNDSLQTLARRYGVSTKQLMAMNHLKSNQLKPGQTLVIANSGTSVSAKSTKQRIASKIRYVVKRGDTLDSIAREFSVERDDLQRWNKITGSHIIPGHILTVMKPDEA